MLGNPQNFADDRTKLEISSAEVIITKSRTQDSNWQVIKNRLFRCLKSKTERPTLVLNDPKLITIRKDSPKKVFPDNSSKSKTDGEQP